tara:strand:- start:431 stop:661 length:231 start_codon:yes stop_codon:yes gene_type:complete
MDNIFSRLPKNIKIDTITLQKMAIIYNAIQDGWEVKRRYDKYIFIKKHEGKKEIYQENFLKTFIESNIDLDKLKDN